MLRGVVSFISSKNFWMAISLGFDSTNNCLSVNDTMEIESFCPVSQSHWREWLMKNHESQQSVWLIMYKKASKHPTIDWNEAVDVALCFGWIDSKRRPLDEEKFLQFFSKRKPNGTWSKVNKQKVQLLINQKLMQKAGLESIAIAKKNGSWNILDEVEELIIPADLEKEFKSKPGAKDFFLSLSKSVRRSILLWLVLAKKTETRSARIKEIARLAALNQKLKQF